MIVGNSSVRTQTSAELVSIMTKENEGNMGKGTRGGAHGEGHIGRGTWGGAQAGEIWSPRRACGEAHGQVHMGGGRGNNLILAKGPERLRRTDSKAVSEEDDSK